MYPTKKLGHLGKVIRGVTYSKGDLLDSYGEGCLTLLRANNINNGINFDELQFLPKGFVEGDKILKEGDIIFCMSSGSRSLVGKNTIVPELENHSFGAFCSSFGINSDDNINYIGYFLKSETYKKYIYSLSQGVNILNLRGSDLENLEIPLPPLSTQSRIVARLDSAFASIDEQVNLLLANIADVENMKFGVIEKIFEEGNFEIKTLKDVCERIMDGTHFSPKNSDAGDRLYVSAKNIKFHGVDLTKATYISKEDHDIIYKRCPVKKGDVLYIKDGATTGIATINQLDEEFSLLSSVAVFQVKKSILSEQFLNYYLNSNFGKKHMISMMGGAAITRLTLTKLNSGLIPLPPLPRQHEIVVHLDRVFAETTLLRGEYEAQIRDLEILKQSLLEEAFAGRLVTDEV